MQSGVTDNISCAFHSMPTALVIDEVEHASTSRQLLYMCSICLIGIIDTGGICLFWFFCCCVNVLLRGGLREAELLPAEFDAVGEGVESILRASSCDMSDIFLKLLGP